MIYEYSSGKSHKLSDPAPRGAYRGRAPPNDCLCSHQTKIVPPKRGLCPEEINRLGATGVLIKAQIGVFVD